MRRRLLERTIEIAPGFGPLAGTTWRIGLMGYNADPDRLDRLPGGQEEVLTDVRS